MALHEQQPEESGAVAAPAPSTKARRALSALKRELTEEDLKSPGALKMILEEVERLTEETQRLKSCEVDFHRADKALAVLQEKHRTLLSVEVISGAALAIGSLAVGYAPAVWNSQPTGWIVLIFGVVLVVGSIVAKAIKL